MPERYYAALLRIHPLRLFLLLLVAVFLAEAAVMVALPHVTPAKSSVGSTAVLDAWLLTVVLAPLVWWLVVQPLRRVARVRQYLVRAVLSAQENERRRIARDLHDGLGQSLTCLLVGLRAIEELSSDERIRTQARELRRIGGETHDEVRRLARGLRPAVLDDAGLIPALERFVEEIRSTQKVDVQLETAGTERLQLDSNVETALYRIVQEGVTNAIRHGAATNVSISLRCHARGLELSIVDNGRGFDPVAVFQSPDGRAPFGLLSIRERADLAGGEATIESTPGAGSRWHVRVPWSDAEQLHA